MILSLFFIMTTKYLKWVKQANLPPLTNTEAEIAEWLLKEENSKIDNFIPIIQSIRKFVREEANNNE